MRVMHLRLETPRPRVTHDGPRGVVAAYCGAHFGKSLLWHCSEIYFAFYLTDICGLSPMTMGGIIALTLLLNAAADLGVGLILSRTDPGVVRIGDLQWLGATVAVGFFVAFSAVSFLAPEIRAGWALAALAGFRLAYSMVDVPQNAMLGILTDGRQSAARLAAWRNMSSGIARILIAMSFAPFIQAVAHAHQATNLLLIALTLGIVAAGGAFALSRVLRADRSPSSRTTPPVAPESPLPLPAGGAVLAMMFITSVAATAFARAEPYLAVYIIKTTFLSGLFVSLIPVTNTLSQPLWLHLARRLSLRRLVGVGAGADRPRGRGGGLGVAGEPGGIAGGRDPLWRWHRRRSSGDLVQRCGLAWREVT